MLSIATWYLIRVWLTTVNIARTVFDELSNLTSGSG